MSYITCSVLEILLCCLALPSVSALHISRRCHLSCLAYDKTLHPVRAEGTRRTHFGVVWEKHLTPKSHGMPLERKEGMPRVRVDLFDDVVLQPVFASYSPLSF